MVKQYGQDLVRTAEGWVGWFVGWGCFVFSDWENIIHQNISLGLRK